MAHKKAGSTAKTNRDSISKRLGVKKYGGEAVSVGNIIVRQRGNKIFPGVGVKQGNDYTLFAIKEGKVTFGRKLSKKIVSVI
jgi:large subunit ribosomal protein L27